MQLPSNVSAADSPNSFARSMHDEIALVMHDEIARYAW